MIKIFPNIESSIICFNQSLRKHQEVYILGHFGRHLRIRHSSNNEMAPPRVFLYSNDISPSCRTVLMVIKEINLEIQIREVNLDKQEHLSEEFLKINPLHTIPVLNDHGYIIRDSHAIACYMVDDFSNNIKLYPRNLQTRALVCQSLIFEAERIFPPLNRILRPILLGQKPSISKEDIDACKEAYSMLNKVLEGQKWLVEDHNTYTVADISCVALVTSGSILVDMDQYPNVQAWIKRCEEEIKSYNECNVPGLNKLHDRIRSVLFNS